MRNLLGFIDVRTVYNAVIIFNCLIAEDAMEREREKEIKFVMYVSIKRRTKVRE